MHKKIVYFKSMNELVRILKKTEIYFIVFLFCLNVYCAFALRGDNFVNSTHLMMAAIMLMFANDKIIEKLEKK